MNIYASHSSLIHFQPALLPHLVGGAWLILCLLTVAAALTKTLPAEVKLPLVGLGTTTLVLMLGDAVVPTTVLLLSVHAAYFAHTSAAIIFTFLASAILVSIGDRYTGPFQMRLAVVMVLAVLALNGIFLSVETYPSVPAIQSGTGGSSTSAEFLTARGRGTCYCAFTVRG